MISRAIRLFETRRAVSADFKEPIGEFGGMFALHLPEPFANRFGNGLRHALSGKPSQLSGKFVSVFVFDI